MDTAESQKCCTKKRENNNNTEADVDEGKK